MTETDPQPETALALLYRHGLPEDVIDGALALHAQELAALQRLRMDELDLTGQKARIVGRIVDLIDPTKTPAPDAAVPSAPADRAAVLSDTERQFLTYALDLAADQMASRANEFGDEDTAALETLRRMADEAQQPTPCSQPNACDADTGELCATHEEEQAHADGEHEYCGVTCGVQFPSKEMRNFVVAKGYPGTAGMLDELLRRAAMGQLPAVEARQAETQATPWTCAHCGQPITSDGPGYDWAGPVPWPGEPQQRFHIALEYPECRAASGAFGTAAVSQPGKEA